MRDSVNPAASSRPATSRVLLVEDVPAMRLLLRLALQRAGMEVVEAGDLAAARRALGEVPPPTSVLLDLALPDGDGLELVGEIPGGIPVAALTADDSRETTLRCREAGCAGFFAKGERPGDPAAIVRAIENLAQVDSLRPAADPELHQRYVAYLEEMRLELGSAGERGDFNAMRNVAHRLRGTAVHFGFGAIGASARALSEALASGRAEGITAALAALYDNLVTATGAA